MSEEREAPAADFAALFSHARYANQRDALARSLGLLPAEDPAPPAGPEPPPSFDGGAREMAPGPSDPEAEFNRLMGELLRRPTGGGGLW